MAATAAGRGAATTHLESCELQMLEDRMRSARERRISLKDVTLTNCTTRENSCNEDEGSQMWKSLSENSMGSASGTGIKEPFEYPFYDDDDDDREVFFTIKVPEGPPLSDSVGDGQEEDGGGHMLPAALQPSVGSALHGSGQCRPCAWYWKPGSCDNGAGCRHCHVCPEGEILRRKRSKVKEIRRNNGLKATSEKLLCQAPSPMMVAAESMPVPPGPPGFELPETLLAPSLRPPPGLELELPSVGSSLHAVNMCKPCAWYWKPGGCQNAQECNHCHLCPPGELAARKRVKDMAIRAGAIQRRGLKDRTSKGQHRGLLRI